MKCWKAEEKHVNPNGPIRAARSGTRSFPRFDRREYPNQTIEERPDVEMTNILLWFLAATLHVRNDHWLRQFQYTRRI